jgi:rod shape-determining protein MreB
MIGAWWSRDVAVDFGTATTRVSIPQRTRVLESPSRAEEGPALRSGAVVNREAAASVLYRLMQRLRHFGVLRPRLLACVPTDVSPDERDAVFDSLSQVGAAAISVVPEPLAAAVGAGLDVSSPYAQLVVDIGHGVTDCAVIRSSEVTVTRAVRCACSDLQAAAAALVMQRFGLELLPGEADRLVRLVGVVPLAGRAERFRVNGRAGSLGVRVAVDGEELAETLEPVVARMLSGVTALVRELPAHYGAEIVETGILLTGGGALLPGMTERLAAETGVAVRRAADPLRAVIRGAREILPTVARHDLWQHHASGAPR